MYDAEFATRYDLADGKVTRHRKKDGIGRTILQGNLTRVGVLPYRLHDGTIRRELRHPAEVFAEASMNSLRAAPVTDLHPSEPVNKSTFKSLAKGVVSDVKAAGSHLAGTVAIDDDGLVAALENGTRHDVSPGYTCRLDNTPGVYNGEPYDAVQRDIRYNHLAVGPKGWGRSGTAVALRLDGVDTNTGIEITERQDMNVSEAETIETEPVNSPTPTPPAESKAPDSEEITAPDVPAPSEDIAVARVDAIIDELRAERDALQVRLDATEKQLATVKAPDISALVAARVQLERNAARLAPEIHCDGMGTRDVMAAALLAKNPAINLAGKSDEYVAARFDIALEGATSPARRTPVVVSTPTVQVRANSTKPSPRQRMIDRMNGRN